MTDVRRSILWVMFLGSIMMLWDAWSVHRGGVSMFAPPQAPIATVPAAASGIQPNAASAAAPAPTATPLTNGVAQGSALPTAPGATLPPQGELVTVTTDVARVTFDALGASVVKLELLKHLQTPEGKESGDHKPQPVVLFDRSATHTYVAQSGLVQAGASAPNHQTAMRVLPGVRTLAPGQDSLKVIFEGEEGGVALTKHSR